MTSIALWMSAVKVFSESGGRKGRSKKQTESRSETNPCFAMRVRSGHIVVSVVQSCCTSI